MSKEVFEKEYEWLIENEDETITVKTKIGDFVMEELTDEELEKVSKLSEKTGKALQSLLARKCITSPEVTDVDFSKMKASVTNRLKIAAAKINGLNDFL